MKFWPDHFEMELHSCGCSVLPVSYYPLGVNWGLGRVDVLKENEPQSPSRQAKMFLIGNVVMNIL